MVALTQVRASGGGALHLLMPRRARGNALADDARALLCFGQVMRLAFMGTPDFALPALDALVGAGHDVACVYTQPPRPAGRGNAPRASPVQQRAEALGLAVRTPSSLRDPAEQAAFAALGLDAAVVAAYGLILPQPVLDAPARGCLNIHASLLPRWRGAAPIQRAILAGDRETGVTIMQMERGLDTGPMLLARTTPIGAKDAGALTTELAAMGAAMMVEVLGRLAAFPPVAQPDGATLAPKIDKAEARLDWSADCDRLVRQVRAFAPAPGAWFDYGGERIRLLAAQSCDATGEPGEVIDGHLTIACAIGAVRPLRVQRAGRGVMPPDELLRGFPIPAGTRLA